MKFYLDGKKITKKQLEDKFGKEKIQERINSAKEEWNEEPMTLIDWADGMEIRNELQ